MILLDTHALIWYLQGESRLGAKAREQIESSSEGEGVGISAITPWEIAMLVGKNRLRLGCSTKDWMRQALVSEGVEFIALDLAIAIGAGELTNLHGDPADRILIATARARKCPLMTADQRIIAYGEAGHVRIIDARR